jgi:protein SCO1/2
VHTSADTTGPTRRAGVSLDDTHRRSGAAMVAHGIALRRMKRALIIAGLIVALVVGAYVGLRVSRPYVFAGTVIQSPESSYDFTLQSASGPVSLSDFRGKVVVLYFGYTFCPDVCPTTMSDLATAMKLLDEKADDVQVIMVSVDPERDTPKIMKEYVQAFDPAFIGLSGTSEQIAATAAKYGVFYAKQEGSDATGYLISHTATVMVIDAGGRLKLLEDFGTTPEDMAADLKHVIT